MPKVAIGVCTYKGARRVSWCLESIFRTGGLDKYDARVVVLDDGSPDGGIATAKVADKYSTPFIHFTSNRGIPAAWNALTNYYNADITILLNDDIVVTPYWLESMIYFLENNPNAGSASYIMYFTAESDLPKIVNGEVVIPRDPISRRAAPDKIGVCEGIRPGRIMCPAGAAFGFTREKYKLVEEHNKTLNLTGAFPEEFISFHEESHFGTVLASKGYPTYGLTWPYIWHIWSATFAESPELNAGWRMGHSREMYCKAWNVPEQFRGNPFEFTNPHFMPQIPPNTVKWLGKEAKPCEELEPDTRVEHI